MDPTTFSLLSPNRNHITTMDHNHNSQINNLPSLAYEASGGPRGPSPQRSQGSSTSRPKWISATLEIASKIKLGRDGSKYSASPPSPRKPIVKKVTPSKPGPISKAKEMFKNTLHAVNLGRHQTVRPPTVPQHSQADHALSSPLALESILAANIRQKIAPRHRLCLPSANLPHLQPILFLKPLTRPWLSGTKWKTTGCLVMTRLYVLSTRCRFLC